MPEILLCCALRCSHCHFGRGSVLPSAASTLPSVEAPTFVRFLHFFTGFCHYRIFHTSLSAIIHTSLSPFFFMNSRAFLYYLSFLLPDEACGRSVVKSSVCCFSGCFSLIYYTILSVLHKCRKFFSVAHFCAAIFVFSARCGSFLLLLQLCLHLKQLRSSAFSPFFTGFCHFRIFRTPLSAIFHITLSLFILHKLMRFLILSFISSI